MMEGSNKKTEDSLSREFPFKLEVYVDTRPNLRHESVENDAYLCRRVLEALFDHMREVDATMLTLSYPERWLNIIEQRQLYKRIAKYCPKMEQVVILTSSPFIIQCTPNGSCGVFNQEETIDESTEGRCYGEPKMRFMGPGLNVLGGSINVG